MSAFRFQNCSHIFVPGQRDRRGTPAQGIIVCQRRHHSAGNFYTVSWREALDLAEREQEFAESELSAAQGDIVYPVAVAEDMAETAAGGAILGESKRAQKPRRKPASRKRKRARRSSR